MDCSLENCDILYDVFIVGNSDEVQPKQGLLDGVHLGGLRSPLLPTTARGLELLIFLVSANERNLHDQIRKKRKEVPISRCSILFNQSFSMLVWCSRIDRIYLYVVQQVTVNIYRVPQQCSFTLQYQLHTFFEKLRVLHQLTCGLASLSHTLCTLYVLFI